MLPVAPELIVPPGRRLAHPEAAVRRRTLRADEVANGVTTPIRTVLDCAADLDFVDALPVADSALRHGAVDRDELLARARTPKQRRVAEYADGRAANPFESVLRALAIECGLGVIPQYAVSTGSLTFRPDLADPLRGIILEADSYQFHGGVAGHNRDCERYNLLALADWLVLRFTWQQVMLHHDDVREQIRAAMSLRTR